MCIFTIRGAGIRGQGRPTKTTLDHNPVKIHPLCISRSERKGQWGTVYVMSQGDSSVKILHGETFLSALGIDH